jgi:hypothetical protein
VPSWSDRGVERRIVGFHTDEEGHWVADLECGHAQHVRHDPPWQLRPWVITPEGRQAFLGSTLRCVKCGPADAAPHGAP